MTKTLLAIYLSIHFCALLAQGVGDEFPSFGSIGVSESFERRCGGETVRSTLVRTYNIDGRQVDSAVVSKRVIAQCVQRELERNQSPSSAHVLDYPEYIRETRLTADGGCLTERVAPKLGVTVQDTLCLKGFYHKHIHVVQFLYYDVSQDCTLHFRSTSASAPWEVEDDVQLAPTKGGMLCAAFSQLLRSPYSHEARKRFFDAFPANRKLLLDAYRYSQSNDEILSPFAHLHYRTFAELRHSIDPDKYMQKVICLTGYDSPTPETFDIENELLNHLFELLGAVDTASTLLNALEQSADGDRERFWTYFFKNNIPPNSEAIKTFIEESFTNQFPQTRNTMKRLFDDSFPKQNHLPSQTE